MIDSKVVKYGNSLENHSAVILRVAKVHKRLYLQKKLTFYHDVATIKIQGQYNRGCTVLL